MISYLLIYIFYLNASKIFSFVFNLHKRSDFFTFSSIKIFAPFDLIDIKNKNCFVQFLNYLFNICF